LYLLAGLTVLNAGLIAFTKDRRTHQDRET
jgi:hypothetical protein